MTNQNLFLEIEKHLLEDVKPSIFLNKIKEEESFKNSSFNIFFDSTISNSGAVSPENVISLSPFINSLYFNFIL